jgi:hypothetical protein
MQMGNKEAGKGMEAVWGRRRTAPPPEDDDGEVERSRATKAKNDPLSVYGNQPPSFLSFSCLPRTKIRAALHQRRMEN